MNAEFKLSREPNRIVAKTTFENTPTTQRPLFIGANDERGQTYLFEPIKDEPCPKLTR